MISRDCLVRAGFTPVQCLGRGGAGDLYEVTRADSGSDKPWVVRVIALHAGHKDRSIDRTQELKRRLDVLTGLEHSHIVRIHDYGFESGCCWIRTDLAPGDGCGSVTLQELADRSDGVIEPELLIELMAGALAGVAHAHSRGTAHGCLKPSNIMLYRLPDRRLVARVADFGMSDLLGENSLRRKVRAAVQVSVAKRVPSDQRGDTVRRLVATWQYWAPEQQSGGRPDPRSDVFSLGLICYRLITGRKLSPRPPSSYNSRLSQEYDSFILEALDSDPGRRHADAGRMLEALEPARNVVRRTFRERRVQEIGRQVAECRAAAADLAAKGSYDEALVELQRMMEEFPGRQDLVEDYSAMEDRRHKAREALRIEEDYHWELREAENLEKAGDIDGAVAIWRNLHALCPDKPEPLERLAVIEEQIRIRDEAQLKADIARARVDLAAESGEGEKDLLNERITEYRRLRSEVWDAVESGRFGQAAALLKDLRERFSESASLQNEIDLIEDETFEARRNARRGTLIRWLIGAGALVMAVSILAIIYFYLLRT